LYVDSLRQRAVCYVRPTSMEWLQFI